MYIATQDKRVAIGTSAAPATLTAAYTGNTSAVMLSRYLQNVNILGSYVPAVNNSVLNIVLEMSSDGTNWQPVPVQESSSTVIKMYTEDMALQFPGDGTSTAATAIPVSFQFTCNAEYVRVKAKETSSGAFGTLWLEVLLTNTP